MKIKLKKNDRIIFTDIEIDSENGCPVAVVDYKNAYGYSKENLLECKDDFTKVRSTNTNMHRSLLDLSDDD